MILYAILLALFVVCIVESNNTSLCAQTAVSVANLDLAIDLLYKVKQNIPECSNCSEILARKAVDCADILLIGQNTSGVYIIWPMNRLTDDRSLNVYCDMETDGGGWTVIQRRGSFQRAHDYFYKDWKSYKEGFGDLDKDFWLGNDNIYVLTNQKLYSARFDLQDVEKNKTYAKYDKFWIDNEDQKYTLHIYDYSGNAGDSLISHHSNIKFSTEDQDNDNQDSENCAQIYKGGWWYNKCHHSNLNGLYLRGKHESFANGVNWLSWKGYHESLENTEIKIRPRNFRPISIRSSTITPM